MIKFQNVTKRFNQHIALDGVSLELPRSGLIVIQGPSGCGKTTLLNLLSGLLSFEGDIEVDSRHLSNMNEYQLSEFRIHNYGFIFQDFKLFESETVFDNIMFPLETISNAKEEFKKQKCKDLINLVGLKKNLKQKVNKLSGGEKQRVAIARALINNPKIILADEPTGALDEKTAEDIMYILEKVSVKSLVIVVSHDQELAKRYADQIIEMKDGKIKGIKYCNKKEHDQYIPIARIFHSEKKPTLSSSFLFHHTITAIKQRKWRTMICNLMTSLGLIGVGLAVTLSSAISNNIKSSYSSIVDDAKIMVSLKDDSSSVYGQYAGSYYEAMELKEKYDEYIFDVGVTYYNNFEDFFPDGNYIACSDTTYRQELTGISARHINEFKWLDTENVTIYPERINTLEDDQVVFAFTINMVQDLCYQLQIERTVTSLSRYLQTHQLHFYFNLENKSWQYSDQQIVQMVGFTLEKQAGIYHTNHLWNEYMFEERMRFPTSDQITSSGTYPWTLKKIYYFYSDEPDSFLKESKLNVDFETYILEIANTTYFPWLYKYTDIKNIHRILFFANTLANIPPRYIEYFQDINQDVVNPIYGSNGGYFIYPSSMLIGFSNYIYFSGTMDKLDQTIDALTSLNESMNQNIELLDGVVAGHYSLSLSDGVKFAILNEQELTGRVPSSLDEITISTGLAKRLFNSIDVINEKIYVTSITKQRLLSDGTLDKTFKTLELSISGLVNQEKNVIYHDSTWPLCFFQSRLGISAYSLQVNTIALDIKNEKEIDSTIKKMKKAFPNFVFSNPMSEINQSVNKVCNYLKIALACFSLIAVVISTILLSICNYLHVLENKKDIGLARCLGVNQKESKKFLLTNSVIMCLFSFMMSAIELFLVSFIIALEMNKQTGGDFVFSFSPIALLYMFLLAFFISVFSSLIITKKMNKLNPIEALKQ